MRPSSESTPATWVSSCASERETVPGNRRAPGAEPYGIVGAIERVDAVRELESGRLGLELIGAEGKVRAVRLERADRDDHERVRREPALERAGIEVEQSAGKQSRGYRRALGI